VSSSKNGTSKNGTSKNDTKVDLPAHERCAL
jgi:hypothetical protein